MNTALVLGAVIAVGLAGGIAALFRACHTDTRRITAYQHRQRTANEVMDDCARWRATRDLKTCQAIWQLPTIPQQRKETGQ